MSVVGKTVLVTGASRGLGRAVAAEFLREGASVIGIGRDPKAIAITEVILGGISENFRMVALDVRDERGIVKLIGGLDRLDVLINNAGIVKGGPILDTDTESLREVIDVNLIAPFVIMRESIRKMLEHGGGDVINVGSDASIRGISGMPSYVASKHGLRGLTRSVRLDVRSRGVRVSLFCPGPINTEICGPGAWSPQSIASEDAAKTIVHMASSSPGVEIQEVLMQPTQFDAIT